MITPESVLKCFAALLNTSERASISTAVFKGFVWIGTMKKVSPAREQK